MGSIIVFVIIGIVAGYVGRLIYPGEQRMGFVQTALLGMVGSLVGGILAALVFSGELALNAAGIIGSIVGVLIVLFLITRMGRA